MALREQDGCCWPGGTRHCDWTRLHANDALYLTAPALQSTTYLGTLHSMSTINQLSAVFETFCSLVEDNGVSPPGWAKREGKKVIQEEHCMQAKLTYLNAVSSY